MDVVATFVIIFAIMFGGGLIGESTLETKILKECSANHLVVIKSTVVKCEIK